MISMVVVVSQVFVHEQLLHGGGDVDVDGGGGREGGGEGGGEGDGAGEQSLSHGPLWQLESHGGGGGYG